MSYAISLSTYESQDAANNQSTVTSVLYFRAWNGGGNYAYWNYNTSFSITIGGNTAYGSGPRSVNTNGSGGVNSTDSGWFEIGRHSVTFTHDGSGNRGAVGTSAGFDGSGGYSPGHLDATGATMGAINYNRVPYTPSTPTLVSRDRNSISMTTSAGVPSGAPGVSYYNWQYSTDGSNWGGIALYGGTITWPDADKNTQYYFRSQAVSTEGGGNWSAASSLISAAPSQPGPPTISRNGTSVNLSFSAPASNGSVLSSYTVQRATNSSFTEGLNTTSGIGVPFLNNITLSPGVTYYFRVKIGSNRGDSDYSASSNITIPPIPLAPTITTPLVKEVRKVTIDWNAPSTSGGAAISSYEVYAKYSSDGGSTWDTDFTLLTTTSSNVTIYKTADLNIAKTYQFRVRALTDVGNTEYSDTTTQTVYNTIFISAYGYRFDGTNFNTAIQYAARYTNNPSDSIVVNGVTYTGWKTIENVQRFNGTEFIPLTQ